MGNCISIDLRSSGLLKKFLLCYLIFVQVTHLKLHILVYKRAQMSMCNTKCAEIYIVYEAFYHQTITVWVFTAQILAGLVRLTALGVVYCSGRHLF